MNSEVFVTCAVTGAGDTAGTQRARPGDAPSRSRTPRSRPRRRAPPIAHIHVRDPETGARLPRSRALSRGRRADPRSGRRRRPQPDRRHGRRSRARRRRDAACRSMRRDRHGRRRRAARARRGAAAGDLHARLRHDELRRGRLHHGQHAEHAARDGAPGARSSACARSSRCSTPGQLVLVHELIARRADRRSAADPALHGHPLRRARRSADAAGDGPERLPPARVFSAFSIGRMQLPYVALAALVGGNVRVGLEDNLYLSHGRAWRRTASWSSARSRSSRR